MKPFCSKNLMTSRGLTAGSFVIVYEPYKYLLGVRGHEKTHLRLILQYEYSKSKEATRVSSSVGTDSLCFLRLLM